MSLTLITVNTGIPSDSDTVEVAETALPYLHQWMSEHGYVRRDQWLHDRLQQTQGHAA